MLLKAIKVILICYGEQLKNKMQLPIKNNHLKIKVKPNSPKTEITKIEKDIIKLNVKAPPEKGRANREIIRFFTKLLKKKVTIIKGFKNKEKILKIL